MLALVLLLASCQATVSSPAKPGAVSTSTAEAPAAPATAQADVAPTGVPSGAQAARLPERIKVSLGTTPGTVYPLYLAIERGYLDELNLEVELQDIASAADIPALLTRGEVDFGATAPTPGLFNAISRGLPIKFLLDANSYVPGGRSHVLLARQDLYDSGQLRTMEQMRNRRVALATVQGSLAVDLDRALRRVGLTIEDVETVQLPFPDHAAALANGSIEAAVSLEPFAARSIDTQVGSVMRALPEDYPDHQVAVLIISTKMVERPAVVRAFAVAWVRGARDYERARTGSEDADAVAAILSKYNRLQPAQVASLLRDNRLTGVNPAGRINLDSIQYDIQWYRDHGYLERDMSPSDFVDSQYAEYATSVLGPYRP
jgi:NitT/TauT family transport system substrate-binding protein